MHIFGNHLSTLQIRIFFRYQLIIVVSWKDRQIHPATPWGHNVLSNIISKRFASFLGSSLQDNTTDYNYVPTVNLLFQSQLLMLTFTPHSTQQICLYIYTQIHNLQNYPLQQCWKALRRWLRVCVDNIRSQTSAGICCSSCLSRGLRAKLETPAANWKDKAGISEQKKQVWV